MIDDLQAARLNHSLDSLNAGQQHRILPFIIVSASPSVHTSSSIRISMAGLLCHRPPSTVFTMRKFGVAEKTFWNSSKNKFSKIFYFGLSRFQIFILACVRASQPVRIFLLYQTSQYDDTGDVRYERV
jgi:hypothetical protein